MSPSTVRDMTALAGLALVGTGVAMFHLPTALILCGLTLIGGSVWGHYTDESPPQSARES